MNLNAKKIISNYKDALRLNSKLTEVRCFRALLQALRLMNGVVTREFHQKSYVKFNMRPRFLSRGKSIARCELSDLVIITFSSKTNEPPKITFLQAKYNPHQVSFKDGSVDLKQFFVIKCRPLIEATGRIKGLIEKDILRNAKLPSITSYGFFLEDTKDNNSREFEYFSSRILYPLRKHTSKSIHISNRYFNAVQTQLNSIYPNECLYCPNLGSFIAELKNNSIGSPIHSNSERRFVSGLIRSIREDRLEKPTQLEESVLNNLEKKIDFSETRKGIRMRTLIIDTSIFI